MTHAFHIGRVFNSVEMVDVSERAHPNSEHVTTIAESNLATILHHDVVVFRDRIRKHVHEHDFVTNGCQDVESTWMESNGRGILTWRVFPGHLKFLLRPIPDADVGGGAGHDELLAKADIHACDFLVVERTMNILTFCRFHIRTIQSQIELQELILAVDIVQDILC